MFFKRRREEIQIRTNMLLQWALEWTALLYTIPDNFAWLNTRVL